MRLGMWGNGKIKDQLKNSHDIVGDPRQIVLWMRYTGARYINVNLLIISTYYITRVSASRSLATLSRLNKMSDALAIRSKMDN